VSMQFIFNILTNIIHSVLNTVNLPNVTTSSFTEDCAIDDIAEVQAMGMIELEVDQDDIPPTTTACPDSASPPLIPPTIDLTTACPDSTSPPLVAPTADLTTACPDSASPPLVAPIVGLATAGPDSVSPPFIHDLPPPATLDASSTTSDISLSVSFNAATDLLAGSLVTSQPTDNYLAAEGIGAEKLTMGSSVKGPGKRGKGTHRKRIYPQSATAEFVIDYIFIDQF
jgi:hypothetical protein